MSPSRRKIGIRRKVAFLILRSIAIVAITGLGLGYFLGYRLIDSIVKEDSMRNATLLAQAVNRMITEEVEDITVYSHSNLWRDYIDAYNKRYESMTEEEIAALMVTGDSRWVQARNKDLIAEELLATDLSQRLKKVAEDDTRLAEIFVTDRHGGLVAASGETSDFFQADKKWWQDAYADGAGVLYVSRVEFDKSASLYGISVALPIKDRANKVIGICKAIIDVERLFQPLDEAKFGKSGYAGLMRKDGSFLYNRGLPKPEDVLCRDELRDKLFNKGWAIITRNGGKRSYFVCVAKVTAPVLLENNRDWYVFVIEPTDEIFAPLNRLFTQMGFVIFVLALVGIFLGVYFAGRFVKPIKDLHVATEEIIKGNWEYAPKVNTDDEIEQLAGAFNTMIVAIKERQKIIEDYSKNLEERVKERTAQLSKTQEATLNILEDLTEAKKKLEKAFKVKSDFTSTVSHELRTPLAAIKESISLVLDGTTGCIDDQQKEFLTMARRNVDRLARLINDILDFQKLESGRMVFNMQKADINETITETCKTMAPLFNTKGLELILNLAEGLPKIDFDKDKITQVLTNLIDNAAKITEKGSVTIKTDRGDNTIKVSVIDTGPGIAKEDIPKLFKQFEQLRKGGDRKVGGTGLGLAICKEIIGKHNGKIWVESEPGKGAIFSFVLTVGERRT